MQLIWIEWLWNAICISDSSNFSMSRLFFACAQTCSVPSCLNTLIGLAELVFFASELPMHHAYELVIASILHHFWHLSSPHKTCQDSDLLVKNICVHYSLETRKIDNMMPYNIPVTYKWQFNMILCYLQPMCRIVSDMCHEQYNERQICKRVTKLLCKVKRNI